MNDCLQWFATKHWLVASILFPELMIVWALWMKMYGLMVWACFIWLWKNFN